MTSSGVLELTVRYGDLLVRGRQIEWIPELTHDAPLSFVKVSSSGPKSKASTILPRAVLKDIGKE